jgi:hypothetical protein
MKHRLVFVCHSATAIIARTAQLRAQGARLPVHLGVVQHQRRRALAHLRAVEQQRDVSGFGVTATEIQAMAHGRVTGLIACETLVDALL